MGTFILSKYDAVKFKVDPSLYNVMIRITSPQDDFLELENESQYREILKLRFYDFTQDQNGLKVFDENIMDTIIDFFQRHKMCQNLVIHCDQGISRSAGVAVGWLLFKDERASIYKIYHSGKHIPNSLIVEKFCKRFHKDMTLIKKWEQERFNMNLNKPI